MNNLQTIKQDYEFNHINKTKLNPKNYQKYYKQYGLINLFHLFTDVVSTTLLYIGFNPGYSFAHIVIDDYNIYDGHIQFCLDRADEYFQDKLKDLNPEYANPDAIESWQRWELDMLIESCLITMEFLEWLLTIDEDERENEVDKYYNHV